MAEKKCPSCGGVMYYDPEYEGMVCQFCGFKGEIEKNPEATVEELSFDSAKERASYDWGVTTKIVRCQGCGAETVNDDLQIAGRCPFCGSTTVLPVDDSEGVMAPQAVIPFTVTRERAIGVFNNWIKAKIFCPSDFKNNARLKDPDGVYIPIWTFDCDTTTEYSGKFGYTYSDGDGQYTKWKKKSGTFRKSIDDALVAGSRRLVDDKGFNRRVLNYYTGDAKPYIPDYLRGFSAERYSVGLDEAWGKFKLRFLKEVRNDIRRYESADAVDNKLLLSPKFENVTFKYVMCPVWQAAFKYKGQIYRIVINGENGLIDGTYPKSYKILFIILGVIAAFFLLPIIGSFLWTLISIIFGLFFT